MILCCRQLLIRLESGIAVRPKRFRGRSIDSHASTCPDSHIQYTYPRLGCCRPAGSIAPRNSLSESEADEGLRPIGWCHAPTRPPRLAPLPIFVCLNGNGEFCASILSSKPCMGPLTKGLKTLGVPARFRSVFGSRSQKGRTRVSGPLSIPTQGRVRASNQISALRPTFSVRAPCLNRRVRSFDRAGPAGIDRKRLLHVRAYPT